MANVLGWKLNCALCNINIYLTSCFVWEQGIKRFNPLSQVLYFYTIKGRVWRTFKHSPLNELTQLRLFNSHINLNLVCKSIATWISIIEVMLRRKNSARGFRIDLRALSKQKILWRHSIYSNRHRCICSSSRVFSPLSDIKFASLFRFKRLLHSLQHRQHETKFAAVNWFSCSDKTL